MKLYILQQFLAVLPLDIHLKVNVTSGSVTGKQIPLKRSQEYLSFCLHDFTTDRQTGLFLLYIKAGEGKERRINTINLSDNTDKRTLT